MKKNNLTRFSCAIAASVALVGLSAKADTIAQWTFEGLSSSFSVTGTAVGPLAADSVMVGGSGSASGLHANSATVFSSPVGDGSLRSLSANQWTLGDYYQFTITPASGNTYSSIGITYDQNGSGTGPKTFYFAYSTDGTTYTPAGADYGLTSGVTWNSSSSQATHESFDLSAITALNTATTWFFRIVEDSPATGGSITGGNVGTGGTGRIDNFLVTASVTAVPEPSCLALLGGFGLLAWHMVRRRS